MRQRRIINFRGSCTARSSLVLTSQRLPAGYTTESLRLHWAPGCQGQLLLTPYLSPDDVCPSTGPPSGTPLLYAVTQDPSFRGDDSDLELLHEVTIREGGTCLKIYAQNTDWYDHHVDAQITVLLPDEGG
jgi:hypothetical protein